MSTACAVRPADAIARSAGGAEAKDGPGRPTTLICREPEAGARRAARGAPMDEPLRCPPPTLGRVMQLVRANDAESLDLLRKSHPTEFAALLGQQQREGASHIPPRIVLWPPNSSGMNVRAPLHFAVEEGKTAIVQLLLSWGADPHLQLSNGDTALTIACARSAHHHHYLSSCASLLTLH